MAEASHVCSGLKVRAEVEYVQQDLGNTLCLHIATHQGYRHQGTIRAHDESRRKSIEGPLLWCDHVRTLRIEREQSAPLVQRDAVSGHREARTEARIETVDPGHHVAETVRCR